MRNARVKQNALGKGGFPGIKVGNDSYVSVFFYWNLTYVLNNEKCKMKK